jgi:hypothetical protein
MRLALLALARFPAALALLLAATAAMAEPTFLLNWDRCEPFVRNRDFEGPGVYTQTLSITGLPPGTKSLSFDVDLNTWYLTAWEFFPGGCAGPTRLAASPYVAGCDTIPGLEALVQCVRPWDSGTDNLVLLFLMDPAFVADSQRRYGLATITFDLGLSQSECYPANDPLCFRVGPGIAITVDDLIIMFPEHDLLTWNDGSDVPDCRPRRQGLAVHSSSWGRVKAHYR